MNRFRPKLVRRLLGVGFELLEKADGIDGAHLAELLDGGDADLGVLAGDPRERDGFDEGLDDFLVGLDFRPGLEVREVIRVLFLAELGDRVAAHLGVRIAEREEIERDLDELSDL